MKLILERIWLALFARPSLAKWNLYLMNLFQKSLGINNYQSDDISGEKKWLNFVIKNYKLEVVFDVGAHKGDYTKLLRNLGYSGRVYLFEPHPKTFEVLNKQIVHDNNNMLYSLGFSDCRLKQVIYDYDNEISESGSPHATLYSKVITDMHKSKHVRGVEIYLQTIDDFIKENNIKKISLLKIDTEGNEFKILQGAVYAIDNDMVEIIQFEFGEMNAVSGVFFKDFFDLLSSKYHLFRLLPNSLLPIIDYNSRWHEIFIYQNIVAIHKNI